MAKVQIKSGSTSQTFLVFAADSSKSTGAGLTGLVYNSSGLIGYYFRSNGTSGDTVATAITLVTSSLGTFTSGGFKEVDATHMPGVYEVGIPNAVFNSGFRTAVVYYSGATNLAPIVIEFEMTQSDVTDGVHFGLTSLPNAAASASGGLPTVGTGSGQINLSGGRADGNTLYWNGSAVASPATAGVPDVNVKNMNNVAATSITTINANIGETQPINFTGTGGSALIKSDVIDWVSNPAAVGVAAGVPSVNVLYWRDSTPNLLINGKLDAISNIRLAQAQAGAAGTITLDSGASATDNIYNGCQVSIVLNAGVGQTRIITGYVGSTKVATVSPNWTTNPTSASYFALSPGAVDVESWLGTALSTPATAGIPDVNTKNINNVSASSVTTINANVGTTQPVNFTGTAGSALVQSDTRDIAGAAVSTSSAQIGVNVVNIAGHAATVDANNLLEVDVADWNGTAVASPATAGVPDVNAKNINNVSTASVTTINANQGTTQPVNFTGAANSALVKSDMQDIAAASGPPNAIPRGTVTTGASTASVPTSALTINGSAATGVVANQFANRTLLFDGSTTTAGLRGAAAAVTASSASNTPTLTLGTTLPATPASGDTFSIV